MMLQLESPDLAADSGACWVVKDEIVSVEFAAAAGILESAVGPNRYAAGDGLLAGSPGDRWCGARNRFDVKYRPEAHTSQGEPGRYRNHPVRVLAKRMTVAF